ncbi:MAG: S41 family peptidase [Aureispira sp.]
MWWLWLLCCGTAFAQPLALYSPTELQEELIYLEQQLQKKLPNWQVYHPAEAWETRLATVKRQLNRPLTSLQWYQKLNYVLEGVHEGHFTIGEANDVFYTGFATGQFKVLPLIVRGVGDQVYIWTNLSDEETLERGDELLRINGRPIEAIRRQIFEHTLADGYIESSKQLFFQDEFAARYFWFVEVVDSFVLEYRPAGTTRTRTITIAALTHMEMAEWMVKRDIVRPSRRRGLEALFSCSFQEQTALLTLRNFNQEDWLAYEKTPASFYAQVFKRLRKNKVKHLIIDVRGNKGGDKDFVDALLPYLWLEPRQGTYRSLLRTNGYLVESILPNRDPLYFKGQIYVLTDGKTYSTAALLAQYSVQYARAISIGCETGSRLEGFAAGGYSNILLPHSKIKIGIPNAWVKNTLLKTSTLANRGLLPYYKVEPSIEDLLQEKDVVLQKAWDLISEKQGGN